MKFSDALSVEEFVFGENRKLTVDDLTLNKTLIKAHLCLQFLFIFKCACI